MLDIQPGRAKFERELEVLSEWVGEPDVDVALDPEWNVGRRGIPGQTLGRVTSREVNAVSRELAAIVREHDLPPKLLVVHQFRDRIVRGRRRIRPRPGVQVVLNYDGIGSPAPKAAGYAALLGRAPVQRLLALLPARHAADEARRDPRARARAGLPALPVAPPAAPRALAREPRESGAHRQVRRAREPHPGAGAGPRERRPIATRRCRWRARSRAARRAPTSPRGGRAARRPGARRRR